MLRNQKKSDEISELTKTAAVFKNEYATKGYHLQKKMNEIIAFIVCDPTMNFDNLEEKFRELKAGLVFSQLQVVREDLKKWIWPSLQNPVVNSQTFSETLIQFIETGEYALGFEITKKITTNEEYTYSLFHYLIEYLMNSGGCGYEGLAKIMDSEHIKILINQLKKFIEAERKGHLKILKKNYTHFKMC